jgi:thiosulfate/3-mercaptopyruvate sulfurtransferase
VKSRRSSGGRPRVLGDIQELARQKSPEAIETLTRHHAEREILAECATVGITPETPVIVYCFKGARANTFVALEEAGIKNVGIYFGSWNEWSRDPSLPIEEGLPYSGSGKAA